jgi:hypothetical protein
MNLREIIKPIFETNSHAANLYAIKQYFGNVKRTLDQYDYEPRVELSIFLTSHDNSIEFNKDSEKIYESLGFVPYKDLHLMPFYLYISLKDTFHSYSLLDLNGEYQNIRNISVSQDDLIHYCIPYGINLDT